MKPIYRSLMDSFQLDFADFPTGLTNAPALAMPVNACAQRMTAEVRPHAVMMNVQPGLTADGLPLNECMKQICGRAYPILRVTDEAAARELVTFCDENNLGDITLCAPWEKRSLLPGLRRALPLSRGMLDVRGCVLPEDVLSLSDECQRCEATQLLTDSTIARAQVFSLQKRFVQTWIQADTAEELAKAVCAGACGVLTGDAEGFAGLLARFPANSTVRPMPLYAHKGFHVTGETPENSLRGVTEAGRRGYDAAEIDVQPSRDEVLLLQHDATTRSLFDGDLRLSETDCMGLAALRRKAFPEEGLDRLDDVMEAMAAHPETPVLIEIKAPRDTFGVETCVQEMKKILSRPTAQRHPTCIMGPMPPYLDYVHKHLPTLPLAHCIMGLGKEPPESDEEANRQIYTLAMDTRGANAGVNPYHLSVNGRLGRLAHLRGITMFVWTWAFKPWEEEMEPICRALRSCYDGLTSDWVHHFIDLPVSVIADEGQALSADGLLSGCIVRRGREDGHTQTLTYFSLTEDEGNGQLVVPCQRDILPDGAALITCGTPVRVRFE